jgi:hypothetical protein
MIHAIKFHSLFTEASKARARSQVDQGSYKHIPLRSKKYDIYIGFHVLLSHELPKQQQQAALSKTKFSFIEIRLPKQKQESDNINKIDSTE